MEWFHSFTLWCFQVRIQGNDLALPPKRTPPPAPNFGVFLSTQLFNNSKFPFPQFSVYKVSFKGYPEIIIGDIKTYYH